MHILATFATLCCQTRWPRNHSCTTQEHVSFFRDIFGHFRKFRLFRHFCKKRSNLQISSKSRKTQNTNAHTFSKTFSQTCRTRKNISHMKNFLHMFTKCKCTNLQMCKNRRAQIAQICSANIFPNAEITNLHCAQKHKCTFLHMSQFLKCRIRKFTISFLSVCAN